MKPSDPCTRGCLGKEQGVAYWLVGSKFRKEASVLISRGESWRLGP